MKDLRTIFNHPKQSDPERDPHLYDWRRPFHGKDDAAYLNKLLKRRNRKSSPERFSSGSARYNGFENIRKQRVFFTATYSKSIKSHKKYILDYMPQKNKPGISEEKEMFGVPPEDYLNNMAPLHFKWIISPESQNVDLKLLAHTIIKHVENLTGYELYWRGVIHTDTGHHHLHIVVNGKDKNGKSVRFPKDMIKNTIREMTSNIITNMIGERTHEEIEAAKARLPYAKRWTEFDEQLKEMTGKIFINNLQPSLVQRLQFLESIKLATKDNLSYSLKPDFEEVLRATGRYNLYLEEYLKSDLPLRLLEGGSITGKVDKVINFDRDESWNDAIIIRKDNERIYIPVYQLHKDHLEGKTIRIEHVAGGTNRNITNKDIRIVDNKNRDISMSR